MRAPKYSFSILAGISCAALLGTSANAALTISTAATSNVSCSAGVCSATASDAVLNVTDLTNMLAVGSLTVESGDQAKDITVEAPFSWTSSNALTLDAKRSLTVNKAVSDAGPAALTLTYGKKGELRFGPKGNITFTSTGNKFTINKQHYTLVDSIASLAGAVADKPSGHYALAHNYDASVDGTYSSSPVGKSFTGTLEGLGNVISDWQMTIVNPDTNKKDGFIKTIANGGIVTDFGLANASVTTRKTHHRSSVAVLAGTNGGLVKRSFATGKIDLGRETAAGGLVGVNYGSVEYGHASVEINSSGGGLVLINVGLIDSSYATGSIKGQSGGMGGLASANGGAIRNCYATGSVTGSMNTSDTGGLIGENSGELTVSASYSTGLVSGSEEGGLIGADFSTPGSLTNTYWDLDTSGIDDPSQGAGNVPNDPGITGLPDAQLKSALPAGFDPKVWAQNPKINNGYPYLRDNPPEK